MHRHRHAALGLAAALYASTSLAADLQIDLGSAGAEPVTTQQSAGRFLVRFSTKAKWKYDAGSDGPAFSASVEGAQNVIEFDSVGSVASSQNGSKLTYTLARSGAAAVPQVAAKAPQSANASPQLAAAAAPAAAVLAAATNPIAKAAADANAQAALANYSNFLVDMTVPASPAFAVLGSTPKTLIDPQSPRDLGVSLVTKLSDASALGNGVGFDVAPYMLAYGPSLTLDEYRKSRALQIFGRTQLSFGAIRSGDGAAKATRAAVGLAVPLYDEGDPRTAPALQKCYADAFDRQSANPKWTAVVNARFAGRDDEARKLLGEINNELSPAIEACRNNFRQSHWNASRWSLGLGQAYENTSAGGTHATNRSIWTTYAMRIGAPSDTVGTPGTGPQGQLLAHLRATDREKVDNAADPRGFSFKRSTTAGLGFKLGSEKFNVSAELSRSNARYDTGEHENSRKAAVGSEFQINKDLWFVLSVGGQGGLVHGKNSPFVLGSLKFGTASESTGAFGAGSK